MRARLVRHSVNWLKTFLLGTKRITVAVFDSPKQHRHFKCHLRGSGFRVSDFENQRKPLNLLEARAGVEPTYTDLQSGN